ncbi:hypothetical protein CC79DRAFT_183270 [Sarocladium strictum]
MHPTTPWCNFSDGQVHGLETGLDRFRFTEVKLLYGMIPEGQWTAVFKVCEFIYPGCRFATVNACNTGHAAYKRSAYHSPCITDRTCHQRRHQTRLQCRKAVQHLQLTPPIKINPKTNPYEHQPIVKVNDGKKQKRNVAPRRIVPSGGFEPPTFRYETVRTITV